MKHFQFLATLLCFLTAVGGSVQATSWTRCTSVSDLTTGGTFIIGYEATANSGTIVPMQKSGTATTSAAGVLYSGTTSGSSGSGTIDMSSVTETALYEVTIAASTTVDGAITIKCGDNYVGNTNTKNNLKLFTSEATTTSFTPTVGENDVFTLKITANKSYTNLQYNSSKNSERFAVYTGGQKNVVIYKKTTDANQAAAPTLTEPCTFTTSSYDVTITNNESGATVYYTTDDTDPTTSSSSFTGESKTIQISATTTVKAMAVVSGKDNSSVTSATYTYEAPINNTPETAYTVAEVKYLIDANNSQLPTTRIYVKGTVSYIYSSSVSAAGQLSYNISDDGKTTGSTQFKFYNSLNVDSTEWDKVSDLSVGDDVIGYGIATKYSSTYELDANNYLYSHTRKSTLSIDDIVVVKGNAIKPTIVTNIPDSIEYNVLYESDNNDVVTTNVDMDSLITATTTGTANIIAELSADGYKTATDTFVVTVTSDAVLHRIEISGTLTKTEYVVGEEFDYSGLTAKGVLKDSSQVDLTNTAEWSIEPATLSAGLTSITVKATSDTVTGSKMYNITVTKKSSSIAISNMTILTSVTDTTISAETTPVDAELSYTIISGEDVITLTDGKISAVTPGTATVKATYAGNDEYASAETTFTVTVLNAIFYESFDKCGKDGGNDNKWKGISTSGSISCDNSGWTFVSGNAASKCARFGTGKAKGSAKTPAITLTGAAKITFKAGAWDGDATTLNLSATSGTLSQLSVTLSNAAWTDYTVYITGVDTSTQITFAAAQASNNRFFLDEVMVETVDAAKIGETGYPSLEAAYNAAGAGNTITLLMNASGEGVSIQKNLTIDFNDFTYTATTPVTDNGGIISSDGKSLVAGPYNYGFVIGESNLVTFSNGTIKVDNTNSYNAIIRNNGVSTDRTKGLVLDNMKISTSGYSTTPNIINNAANAYLLFKNVSVDGDDYAGTILIGVCKKDTNDIYYVGPGSTYIYKENESVDEDDLNITFEDGVYVEKTKDSFAWKESEITGYGRLKQKTGPGTSIDDISTIESESTSRTLEGIYDLTGRRLSTIPGAGIYIVNGKKVVVVK